MAITCHYPPSMNNQPVGREEIVDIINEVMHQAPHRRMSRPIYRKPYPTWIDQVVEMPRGYRVPEFTLFSRENNQFTVERIGHFTIHYGEASANDFLKLRLFGNSLIGTAFAGTLIYPLILFVLSKTWKNASIHSSSILSHRF